MFNIKKSDQKNLKHYNNKNGMQEIVLFIHFMENKNNERNN